MAKPKMTDVLELSIPERIQFVQDVWDTIADGPDSLDLTEQQKAEIDRRIDQLKAEPGSALSWQEVRARIGL